jgi:hypothetical protein
VGGSLFDEVIKPHLALFHTILHQKQLVVQLPAKQQVVQVTIRPPEVIVCVEQLAQTLVAKTVAAHAKINFFIAVLL